MPRESIDILAKLVHGDLEPDLTLLLDLPVAQGMARAADRSRADRIEQEDLAFFERVREAFLDQARREPERFAVIDAARQPDAVWNEIRTCLEERFGP